MCGADGQDLGLGLRLAAAGLIVSEPPWTCFQHPPDSMCRDPSSELLQSRRGFAETQTYCISWTVHWQGTTARRNIRLKLLCTGVEGCCETSSFYFESLVGQQIL